MERGCVHDRLGPSGWSELWNATDGPALVCPDGFALHAWRGMPVPATLFAELVTLTADRIRTEENAGLRRVMLEFFGYERYLAESGAQPIHRDETGILWSIPLDDDYAPVRQT